MRHGRRRGNTEGTRARANEWMDDDDVDETYVTRFGTASATSMLAKECLNRRRA